MKIKFIIPYHTHFGEEILITGSLAKLGKWSPAKAPRLAYTHNNTWEIELEIKENFQYKYIFKNSNGEFTEESIAREINLSDFEAEDAVIIFDYWQNPKDNNLLFLTAAFKDVIFKPERIIKAISNKAKGKHSFSLKINQPRLNPEQKLCLLGDVPELGSWNPAKALELSNENYPICQLDFTLETDNFSYKYLIKDQKNNLVTFEEGLNRVFKSPEPNRLTVINDFPFRYKNNWRGAGIAVPLFSLLSEQSLGIGEFSDLKLLIDFAAESSFQLIQLLPINDTSVNLNWLDSYPYSGLSVFALHPIYLNIEKLGSLPKELTKEIEKQRKELNSLNHVDYEKTYALKIKLAKEIFKIEKTNFLKSTGFQNYLKENAFWLKPYACFSVLRDKFKTSDFNQWKNYKNGSEELIKKLTDSKSAKFNEIAFYYFLQYNLHLQLTEVSEYAVSKKIILKGDIPIGINKFSDSTWVNPNLFNLDQSAGAPPDMFSETGQNWGFPTYNWEEMAKNDYSWWKTRLKVMARYFQMVRLDHVLGFFRIWQIPTDQISGEMGLFNPNLAYTEKEIHELGFNDLARLLEPYITDQILKDLFKTKVDTVKKEFLIKDKFGFYKIKPEFSKQTKAAALIKDKAIQKGLCKLISNVLFLKDLKKGLNPRFGLLETSSFAALSEDKQKILTDLYYDYFYRRHESFWQQNALVKLPMIKNAANMLICGEDLGMVPDCVPQMLDELSLLSLKIQRMPKESDREFGITETYPYLSVCSTSSHDISTIRAWWEENPAKTARYFNKILNLPGKAPAKCSTEISELIIKKHLESPSMWAIFPIQDLLNCSAKLCYKGDPRDEQINHPEIGNFYWRYRLHIKLNDLIRKHEFIKKMRELNSCRS